MLVDTTTSENFISSKFITKLKISYQEKTETILMATELLCNQYDTLQTQT